MAVIIPAGPPILTPENVPTPVTLIPDEFAVTAPPTFIVVKVPTPTLTPPVTVPSNFVAVIIPEVLTLKDPLT